MVVIAQRDFDGPARANTVCLCAQTTAFVWKHVVSPSHLFSKSICSSNPHCLGVVKVHHQNQGLLRQCVFHGPQPLVTTRVLPLGRIASYLRYLWTMAKDWTTSGMKARSFQTTSKAKRKASFSFNTAASAQCHDAWPLELATCRIFFDHHSVRHVGPAPHAIAVRRRWHD